MIELERVSFTYQPLKKKRKASNRAQKADWGNEPDATWAVEDVSLRIGDGDFVGIAGHTGSGKSTLIQMMNGLLSPAKGRVLVDGVDISDAKAAAAARRSVGLVFQYPEHQLFAASVYEDVAFGPRNLGCSEQEVDARVRKALAKVELDFDAISQASPFELSGGQQRRVAFAGILAMEPKTLILDEPAAGLDPSTHQEFLGLIAHLHDTLGITVVMVSHNMDDLAAHCGRIVVLNQGRVHLQGSPEKVFADKQALTSIGLGLPAAQECAQNLAARGIVEVRTCCEGRVATKDALADALADAYARRRHG